MRTCDEILFNLFMITKQQDTLAKSGHTMQYDNTIGGPVCEPLSKTTFKVVEHVNSLKSTDHLLNLPICLPKERNHFDLLRTVLWI